MKKESSHSKKIKSLILLSSASLLASTALVGCGKPAMSSAIMNKKTPVEIQTVQMSDVGGGEVFSGQITPETVTNVASKLNGKVTAVDVHVGDHVTTGQPLATIDTSQLQQQMQQSQSTVAMDQAQLDKAKIDQENSVLSAEQAVASAKIQLEKAQSDWENNIAQAQQAVEVSQAALDNAKANHAAAIQTAQTTIDSSQANYDNSKQNNDNQIQQLQQAVDQAKTVYKDTLQQMDNMNSQNFAQVQLNVDNAQNNLLKAEMQLNQAEAANSLTDTSIQGPLKQAQTALQNAQNSKDVEVALANYNQAQEKLKELQGDSSTIQVSKQQYDQSKQSLDSAQSTAGVEVAQAQLQSAQTNVQVINEQLQDGVLTSPVDGVVTAINAPVGEMAGGQGSVVSIASTEPTIATVNVPEASIGKVSIGTSMYVQIPTLDKTMEGKVIHIHPMIDSVTKSYGVDVQIPDPGHQLLPGMFTEASLKSEGRQAIMVPADAVLSEANGNAVFIDDHGKAKKILVQIGEMTSSKYEITQGLKIGEQLIVKGEDLLSDGEPVSVVKPNAQASQTSQASQTQGTGAKSTGKNAASQSATNQAPSTNAASNKQAAASSSKPAATGGTQ